MVAYSYKKRFVPNIRAGLGIATEGDAVWVYDGGITRAPTPKRQTIRADRKRHARPGEELQHYCGMRTKHCFLIGRARCTSTDSILIKIGMDADLGFRIAGKNLPDRDAEAFAHADGFGSIEDMWLFWKEEHEAVSHFGGVLIRWEPLT